MIFKTQRKAYANEVAKAIGCDPLSKLEMDYILQAIREANIRASGVKPKYWTVSGCAAAWEDAKEESGEERMERIHAIVEAYKAEKLGIPK